MDKQANDMLRQALLGMLMGGGAYGGMRLLADMNNATKPPKKPKDELELTLPASRLPKVADDHSYMDYLAPMLAGSAGATGGFLGASKLYEMHRQKQLQEQQQKAEQEYMMSLQHAHSKVASVSTPCIDKFLEGLITKVGEEIAKEANMFPDEDTFDIAGHQISKGLDSVAHSRVGSAGIAAWIAAALGAGGLTYGIARNMDRNKAKSNEQSTYPSEIRLKTV
jgi:hypothetical protein